MALKLSIRNENFDYNCEPLYLIPADQPRANLVDPLNHFLKFEPRLVLHKELDKYPDEQLKRGRALLKGLLQFQNTYTVYRYQQVKM